MQAITKYKANDGTEFEDEASCLERDVLLERIEQAMSPMGELIDYPRNQEGWVHHNPQSVLKAKQALLDICKPQYAESWPIFNEPADKIHPFSIVGRILTDSPNPLGNAWGRFMNTDDLGREHSQAFYVKAGPKDRHVCIEDRR